MGIHQANHDIQIVVDQVDKKIINYFIFQYACAQYVVGYLTKNESGMSKMLKAVNDQAKDLSNLELINELSTVLDKHKHQVGKNCYHCRLLGQICYH